MIELREVFKHILETNGNCNASQERCWSCPLKPSCSKDNLYYLMHPSEDKGDYSFRVQLTKEYIINNFSEEEVFEIFL